MPKGPRLNNISRNFTTRDSLGIEGVATSISGEICPVVNTVTPRAFYWPFIVWIYYDFYKYSGIEERSYAAFDTYLKRQDYFFVLATMLIPNSDQTNLVGKQQTEQDILDNPNGPYPFNPAYFKTRFGGMQYYNAGCFSMLFVIDFDPGSDKTYKFPKLTKEGEQMALTFENVIKDTEYYKSYRRNDSDVPKDVLLEYGKVINISLKGFDESKALLRHGLFETKRNSKLTDCAAYIKYLYDNYGITSLNRDDCRVLFYDHITPADESVVISPGLVTIINEWEIVVGRQYFTSGLEMIWKYMLEQLTRPITMKIWFEDVLSYSDFSWDLEQRISDVILECIYDFEQRETMISDAARGKNSTSSVENGIKIILSVYNRFRIRTDLGDEKAFFSYGVDNQSISMDEVFDIVDEFKNKSIKEFILFVMQQWLVKQHYITAFEKILQNRDGFYYEIIDGLYIKKHDFGMDFQGIRMIQLMQVMKDLDML
ncbi:hypothetical protein G9F72_019155 [Clostridium estertheticum]|uniref:hypothetical protein n=1 Tax=Clostridium estertheticum TaxID=238834 RepID=UPI0013E96243|nr:hypothetical protein [Clostridium estertheticum]MBZ9688451.1 hypothetical protein [Clostridium estertheticum]